MKTVSSFQNGIPGTICLLLGFLPSSIPRAVGKSDFIFFKFITIYTLLSSRLCSIQRVKPIDHTRVQRKKSDHFLQTSYETTLIRKPYVECGYSSYLSRRLTHMLYVTSKAALPPFWPCQPLNEWQCGQRTSHLYLLP